jgi:aminoglycoside N3'-acetyltransferase
MPSESPSAAAPATRASLVDGLCRLGVEPGDVLFVHSSFKSLGPVQGGAETVVAALEEALGPDGTLLMPSFNLVEGGNEGRAAAWNRETCPSTVGWLTECFRRMPGTLRSDHYSHAVAARGSRADWFTAEHRSRDGMKSPWDLPPWGKSYGDRSPMLKACRDPRGKVLMLGVDYHSSTYCHVVEVMFWNRQLETDPKAEYYWINREKAGAYWDSLGRLGRGRVGAADCRLFLIRDFVDTVLAAATRAPEDFFKWYPSVEAAVARESKG